MASRSVPRINHVAMSVPGALLRERRADLVRFYGEVFGWTPMPDPAQDGSELVLRVHSNEQFVFLIANDEPMRCPTGDHFGVSVGSVEELEQVLARARAFAATSREVEVSERRTDDFQAAKLHAFYVRYLLPMSVEVQYFEWAPGLGPDTVWEA